MSTNYWKREALRWLDDALEDLKVAEDLLRTEHHSASCFHIQQAAEKAVKATLYLNRVEARSHSTLELLENLERVTGLRLDELYEDARLLDKHYAPQGTQTCIQAFPYPATSYTQGRMPKDASTRPERS